MQKIYLPDFLPIFIAPMPFNRTGIIEWERLEISSRKLEIPREHFMERWAQKRTEAEDIKKSWQEYTKELYKKDLHDPDNHNGVITHL